MTANTVFWKIAGPVFAALVLGSIGIAGRLLDQRLSRIETDVQFLIRLHMGVADENQTD